MLLYALVFHYANLLASYPYDIIDYTSTKSGNPYKIDDLGCHGILLSSPLRLLKVNDIHRKTTALGVVS